MVGALFTGFDVLKGISCRSPCLSPYEILYAWDPCGVDEDKLMAEEMENFVTERKCVCLVNLCFHSLPFQNLLF